MIVAALETATVVTAVALGDDAGTVEVLADDRRRHTEALAPCLASLLASRGLAPRDLDVVVVDVGPGLFTGLRVGVATAKGLAVATGVGLVAVTSTDVLAEAACARGHVGEVLCVVDARRAEVFCARYRCAPEGPTPLAPLWLSTPGALGEQLAAAGQPFALVGDGAARYRDVLEGRGHVVDEDLVVPSPAAAIRLVRRRLAAGDVVRGHADVHPLYVREADAVANFAVREPS